MKTKFLIIIGIVLLYNANVKAQSLSNTTWSVYASAFFRYFHFGADTLSRSSDNISYTNVATYQINGNDFIVTDLLPSTCSGYPPGHYTYLIQNDTLKFTLIDDYCTGRMNVFASDHWVSFATGIPELNLSTNINVFPNPVTNGNIHLNIEGNQNLKYLISIYDVKGIKVFEENSPSFSTTEINLQNISSGIYCVKVYDGKNLFTKKFIVE